jgi:hypothetical protein
MRARLVADRTAERELARQHSLHGANNCLIVHISIIYHSTQKVALKRHRTRVRRPVPEGSTGSLSLFLKEHSNDTCRNRSTLGSKGESSETLDISADFYAYLA